MKVTIHLSKRNYTVPRQNLSFFKEFMYRLRGGGSTLPFPCSLVDLYIYLTNEEKAIIETYSLADVVLEEQPDVEGINHYIEKFNSTTNQTSRLAYKKMLDFARETPIQIKMGQLIGEQQPTHRTLRTHREAVDFIQHLKTDLLPKMKQIIEHYGSLDTASSETFEL